MTKLGQHASTIGEITRLVTKYILVGVIVGTVSLAGSRGIHRVGPQVRWRGTGYAPGSDGQSTWRTLRVRAVAPPHLLHQRCHGSAHDITDSEHRPLRSIGASAYEVATRTSALLTELLVLRGVRIFMGTRPLGTDLPRVSHAISAGHGVVLVESVLWPPGHYEAGRDGRVYCDRVYTGQTAADLAATTRLWRRILPRGHRVSALVIVHSAGGGRVTLPSGGPDDVAWVHPEDAVRTIRRLGVNGDRDASRRTLAALVAATPVQG